MRCRLPPDNSVVKSAHPCTLLTYEFRLTSKHRVYSVCAASVPLCIVPAGRRSTCMCASFSQKNSCFPIDTDVYRKTAFQCHRIYHTHLLREYQALPILLQCRLPQCFAATGRQSSRFRLTRPFQGTLYRLPRMAGRLRSGEFFVRKTRGQAMYTDVHCLTPLPYKT